MSQVIELESWANMSAMTSFRSVSRMLPMLSVVVLALTSCWNEDDASGRDCGGDHNPPCPSGYICGSTDLAGPSVCLKIVFRGEGEECSGMNTYCLPGLSCSWIPRECTYPFASHPPFPETSDIPSSRRCVPAVKKGECCNSTCESGLACISPSLGEPFRCAPRASHAFCISTDPEHEPSNCPDGEVCAGCPINWHRYCFPYWDSGRCEDEGVKSLGELCTQDECQGGECEYVEVACDECESGSYVATKCVAPGEKYSTSCTPPTEVPRWDPDYRPCNEGLACMRPSEAGLCMKYRGKKDPPLDEYSLCWDAPEAEAADGAGSN